MTTRDFKNLKVGDEVFHTASISGEPALSLVVQIWPEDLLVKLYDTLEGREVQVEFADIHFTKEDSNGST